MTEIGGRTAFITGAAHGIGLGIARSLAREGVKLALVDLDAVALDHAKAELSKTTDVFIAVLDVRDREGYARVADAAEAALGPVSVLINNAGVSGGGVADQLTYELWDWGIGINLGGVINGIQTFLPRIVERGGGGHIVNTSSGRGLVVPPSRGGATFHTGATLYATAKYAVVGMSEALRVDLEPKRIGVTVLCPGPVATDIVAHSRITQPKLPEALSAEQTATSEESANYLAQGLSPDVVGDMVRDAIRQDRLYIHTHREISELIKQRTEALLEAVPS